MRPALRALRDEISATFVRIFAYIGAMTVIAIVAAKLLETSGVEAAIEPATRSDWAAVERPYRAFALTIPEFAEPEPSYAIRRHATGGGRRDILSFGESSGAGSRLMVEIYRPGKELDRFGDPATELAARTAELGGPYPLKPAEAIDSKFGRLASFDFTALVGGQSRHCLGFVRSADEPRLQIAGWHCKGGPELIDRGALACALDRLTLLMAASEPKVTEFFANAELKRKFCGQKPVPRATYTQRHDWIDASKEPKLRGRVAGR